MISIIMLTYNAPKLVEHSIVTLRKYTKGVPFELIVLDNHSKRRTRKLLLKLQERGYINKIIFEDHNTLFAKGNNTASKLCAEESNYILLLNSDVEIRDEYWLQKLVERHERGAISYGVCEMEPHVRADGYCFLIDKDLYLKYKLDEQFEWWWSVTKLQAQLLRDSYIVKAVKEHEEQLIHYGGMSGTAWKNSKGMSIEGKEVKRWFDKCEIEIIERISENESHGEWSSFSKKIQRKKEFERFCNRRAERTKTMVKKILRIQR
ncbi:MAG: glycosyltransferase [Lachnospiraceae bacterium]|jgi:glycosyltransferase involved in cell wall biosynthesis|nr:glycosyltransferase [Lachnospiraceae bacterium]